MILVTGGLGFIGSHTVVALQEQGFEVVIIDNLSNSSITVLDGITKITGIKPHFERLDLRNKPAVHYFFDKYKNKIDGVIHFAASKAVGESIEKPLQYYENNIGTLVYLLQEMTSRGLTNLIFSSSCTVYGQADELPITENAPIKMALSPYGYTKQISEEIIRDTTVAYAKFKAIALRYFNPVGAHPSGIIGELPIGTPLNLIPYVTQTAVGIREQLAAIRDYIHVVDLAEAHIAALQRLQEDKNEKQLEFFNIGTGTGSSVMEVINTFEKVNGVKLNYKIAPKRAGDITTAYADTTLANKVLSWKAKLSLADALRDAWHN